MDKNDQLLLLLRAGLTGESAAFPEDADLAALANMAGRSGVLNLFYYGALNAGFSEEHPVLAAVAPHFFAALMHCERQQQECRRLFAAFSAAGIDYMPLKGSVLRSLYPQPDMRAMSDADVLIRMEQTGKIAQALERLGYTATGIESDHEWIFDIEGLHLELHKRLIPSYNEDYYAYYGDGWRLAQPSADDPHRFELSKEDLLIYLFTHFAKHYRDGGIGIRHMIDLWIYRRSVDGLDMTYVQNEMEKLELWIFYKNICDTLAVWFDGAEPTDLTDLVTAFIFGSGVYGKQKEHLAAALLKKAQTGGVDIQTAKRKKYVSKVFPSVKTLQWKYPVLTKCPALLPLFWGVRFFEVVTHPSRFRRNREEYLKAPVEYVAAFEQSLDYVGLRFHFKEK